MWQSLRDIAIHHPTVDIGDFVVFSISPEIKRRFSIHAKPNQTVLGTVYGEELVFAYRTALIQKRKVE